MSNNLTKIIRQEIDDFESRYDTIVDKYHFNQKEILEKVTRLYHSQFKKGEIDSEGFRKYFLNIVRNPCDVATKAISFGRSDIQTIAAPGHNGIKAWLLDRDVKSWLKRTQFSKTLKTVFDDLPVYGTVVLKKAKGRFHLVNLRNLVNEQTADNLRQSSYIIERHYMTPEEVSEQNWDEGAVKEAIQIWRGTGASFLRIYERRGEIPESDFKEGGDPNKYVYAKTIEFVPESENHGHTDRYGYPKRGVTLNQVKESKEDFPYREFHWEKIPGRWLGVGRVELNADPQIRMNEITNLRVKASYFASLNIWQSRDTSAPKNVIQEVANGEIMNVISEITRLPTEERNLAAYGQEEQRWMEARDENSMSYDVIRGERLPAGTPLGSAKIAAQMTSSYFDNIREKIAIDMRQLIEQDVIKDFLKENSREHYLKLVGEDFEHYTALRVMDKTNEKMMEFIAKNKKVPSRVQFEAMKGAIEQKVRKGNEVDIKIPNKYYDDVEYEVDIVITEEARKMQAQSANMTTVLQAIQQDETLLTNPTKRKIFGQLLNSIGLSLADIEGPEGAQKGGVEGAARRTVMRGGGISAANQQQQQEQAVEQRAD